MTTATTMLAATNPTTDHHVAMGRFINVMTMFTEDHGEGNASDGNT